MKCLIALSVLLTPAAYADEPDQQLAFSEGRYVDAVALASVEPNADNFAFAARSLLADAMSAPDYIPPQSLAEQAETYARRALAEDVNHIEGRLQLAIALSLRARPLTNRQAMRAGFGSDARELAEAVLIDDPENIYAHGFMAVWNIEVVRRGGGFGASMIGASIKKARRHYNSAIAIDASDASTHWQYARALTALNAKKYRTDIDAALQAAIAVETESALEALMQARANTLKTALETLPRRDSEALAEQML